MHLNFELTSRIEESQPTYYLSGINSEIRRRSNVALGALFTCCSIRRQSYATIMHLKCIIGLIISESENISSVLLLHLVCLAFFQVFVGGVFSFFFFFFFSCFYQQVVSVKLLIADSRLGKYNQVKISLYAKLVY